MGLDELRNPTRQAEIDIGCGTQGLLDELEGSTRQVGSVKENPNFLGLVLYIKNLTIRAGLLTQKNPITASHSCSLKILVMWCDF